MIRQHLLFPMLSERVFALRGKISHTWLDHEVRDVTPEVAAGRWISGDWPEVAQRWVTLHKLAISFSQEMEQLRASRMIERLPALSHLPPADKAELAMRLDTLQNEIFDVDAVRYMYLRSLADFRAAWEGFLESLNSTGCTADKVAERWLAVQAAGAELKKLFVDGTIPSGCPLP